MGNSLSEQLKPTSISGTVHATELPSDMKVAFERGCRGPLSPRQAIEHDRAVRYLAALHRNGTFQTSVRLEPLANLEAHPRGKLLVVPVGDRLLAQLEAKAERENTTPLALVFQALAALGLDPPAHALMSPQEGGISAGVSTDAARVRIAQGLDDLQQRIDEHLFRILSQDSFSLPCLDVVGQILDADPNPFHADDEAHEAVLIVQAIAHAVLLPSIAFAPEHFITTLNPKDEAWLQTPSGLNEFVRFVRCRVAFEHAFCFDNTQAFWAFADALEIGLERPWDEDAVDIEQWIRADLAHGVPLVTAWFTEALARLGAVDELKSKRSHHNRVRDIEAKARELRRRRGARRF